MRRTFWDRHIAPPVSLAAGLLLMIPFLLTRDPVSRSMALIPLLLPMFLSGRGARILPVLITFAGITLLGLFPAAGKELFRWRFFAVGSESLLRGMGRAALFCGMMLLSRMAIRPGLAGGGSFAGGVLSVFERFLSRREEFRSRDPAAALDRLLLECDSRLWDQAPAKTEESGPKGFTPAGGVLLLTTVLAELTVLLYQPLSKLLFIAP